MRFHILSSYLILGTFIAQFATWEIADARLSAQDSASPTPEAAPSASSAERYYFNRAPLLQKPLTELPLGAIEPRGWLKNELQRMAHGMTGHLDSWYPEVCGPRNAWLGGDGDTWERGPYWIDGLYPLARLLHDEQLQAKAQRWIDWTIENQREDGYFGPVELAAEDRTQPPPQGAQILEPDDWWPRMVMLKILQQHYLATGDTRVIDCMTKYFRYQLETLPEAPLYDPNNPRSGSWWAAQRGGDNMMSVLWLYNVTGEPWLLDLAELLHEQTVPVTQWFLERSHVPNRFDQGPSLHCVNFAQMMKTPIIRLQQDHDRIHLTATRQGFADIDRFHGQPTGLYGGDEALHGDDPGRGSELCSAVEMMFSLEKMIEVTGDVTFADRLERIAFNALPTQCTDDFRARQYFQQTNQVVIEEGDHDFVNDGGDRLVFGLLQGYPCCTCNLHQGWPKFTQHLWMASADRGVAAIAYAPSQVTVRVGEGQDVTIVEETGYPFHETMTFTVQTSQVVAFPLHLRIPGWCESASVTVNGSAIDAELTAGTLAAISREWNDGDQVQLQLPMKLRSSEWFNRAKALERGPLLYALNVEADWKEVVIPAPDGVPEDAMHRGYFELHPKSDWNYALEAKVFDNPEEFVEVEMSEQVPANPWTPTLVPIRLKTKAVALDQWKINRHMAAAPPLSPVERPEDVQEQEIELIPYGASKLRTTIFPWLSRNARR